MVGERTVSRQLSSPDDRPAPCFGPLCEKPGNQEVYVAYSEQELRERLTRSEDLPLGKPSHLDRPEAGRSSVSQPN